LISAPQPDGAPDADRTICNYSACVLSSETLKAHVGVFKSFIYILAREHAAHPITGKVLMLGQQAIYADLQTAQRILRQAGCPIRPMPAELDRTSRFNDDNINARTLFAMLGAESVEAMDVSAYEGADILHDLNDPIDPAYHEKFDVIFDAGTLEHIFDAPTALASFVRMLSVGGQVILISPSSNAVDHGFYSLSPTLFYDFFAANGFGNFSCYLVEASNVRYARPAKIYKYDGVGEEYPFSTRGFLNVAFFATKQTNVACIKKPIQSLYSGGAPSGPAMSRTPMRRILRYILACFPEPIARQVRERQRRKNIHYLARW
jgi:hypothetical protein